MACLHFAAKWRRKARRLPTGEEHALPALYTLISAAREHDLVVFDEAMGFVWLPDGGDFPHAAKQAWKTMDDMLLGYQGVEKRRGFKYWAKVMYQELAPILTAAGFEDKTIRPFDPNNYNGTFERSVNGGKQVVEWCIRFSDTREPNSPCMFTGNGICQYFDIVKQIGIEKDISLNDDGDVFFSTFADLSRNKHTTLNLGPFDWGLVIETEEGRGQIKQMLQDDILPLLNQCTNLKNAVQEIHQFALSPYIKVNLKPRKSNLIAARLVNSPEYPRLRALFDAQKDIPASNIGNSVWQRKVADLSRIDTIEPLPEYR